MPPYRNTAYEIFRFCDRISIAGRQDAPLILAVSIFSTFQNCQPSFRICYLPRAIFLLYSAAGKLTARLDTAFIAGDTRQDTFPPPLLIISRSRNSWEKPEIRGGA